MQQQKWYQSWALWLSIAALIAFMAKTLFHIEIKGWLDEFMGYLLPILVAFGIVNNPNERARLLVSASDVKAHNDRLKKEAAQNGNN